MSDTARKFTIKSELDGMVFEAAFADGAAIVTDGYGGWQITSIPKEVGVTEWQGRNPLAVEIPFVIDYWLSDDSDAGAKAEAKVKRLERLCGIGSHEQPPICTVDGGGAIPHDYTINKKAQWVIESLSWDRAVELRDQTTRQRLRCGGTIVIRKFTTAREVLRRVQPDDRAKQPGTYVVKKGDNLSKIAGKLYKDPSKWRLIADANGIRDRRTLTVGRTLKYPKL
jgi:hypothetical protein